MPSTPTTKSQVQAYKFVLRRMQSALVRKDAVMLHDPMRTHSRATIVGVCLGAVGLVGFLVWGLLDPKPTLPSSDGIVISKESGTVYVLLHNPSKLIPTFNLASARLLLLAQQQHGQPQGEGGQQSAPAGAANVAEPTVVSDEDLQGVPKGRLQGIQDGPQLLPSDGQRISDDWAVCDAYQLDPNLPQPDSKNIVETTVLAGVHDLGQPLGDRSLLVRSDNGKTYLVYHLEGSPSQPTADTVRAEVDLQDKAVLGAMELAGKKPRHITTALLNAIPPVPQLQAPTLAGQGQPVADAVRVRDFSVGTVFSVQNAEEANTTDAYYVQEQDGIEAIKPTIANLIRYNTNAEGPAQIIPVKPTEITGKHRVTHIDQQNIPGAASEVLDATGFPVACLGWSIPTDQPEGEGHTTVYVTAQVNGRTPTPLPKDKVPAGYKGVKITTPADNLKIDYFYMPPGRGAVVRGAVSLASYQTGPIYLVSDRGVKFGVPDQRTAVALGLAKQRPAPDAIVRLLPSGAMLDTGTALQSFDTVSAPGVYETPSPSAQPGAQGGG